MCRAAGKGWPRADKRDAGPGSLRSTWGRGGWRGFVTGVADVSRAARGAGPGAGVTTCFNVLFPHLGMSLGGWVGLAQAGEVGTARESGGHPLCCDCLPGRRCTRRPALWPVSVLGWSCWRGGAPQGSGELPLPSPTLPASSPLLLSPGQLCFVSGDADPWVRGLKGPSLPQRVGKNPPTPLNVFFSSF